MRPPYDPAALLRQADAVLREAQPAFSASFRAGGWLLRARFVYPGRVIVSDRNTGEIIVRSRPGQPTKPAAPARAARHAPGR